MNLLNDRGIDSARNRNVSLRCGLWAGLAFLLVVWPACLWAGLAFLLVVWPACPARAAEAVPSLDLVPADAAFYSVALRNREQFDAVVNSRAFAKLKALPYVQLGLNMYKMQAANPDSPFGKFDAALRDPDTKQSLNVLADLFSDEVFIYGGANFGQTIELVQGVYADMNLNAFTTGVASGFRTAQQRSRGMPSSTPAMSQSEELQGQAIVRALVRRVDLIKFPELVIGFKVKDQAAVKEQLDHLELNLQMLLAQAPSLQNSLKSRTVGGHSYLVLTLNGAMVPWDSQIAEKIRSLAATPADGDKLIEHLKKTTLTISLGLRDNYLLLAIGPSTDVLAGLGKGSSLRNAPELAAVSKYADKRISSVGYSSKALNQHFGQTKAGIDNLLQVGISYLPSLPVPEKLRKQIAKDAADLASDLKAMITEMGATSSIEFLTDSGVEGYTYDWSAHPELDSSKPLDLLKHIGGNPIAVLVGRSKVSTESYDLLVKWIGVGSRYLREFGVPQMKPKEREEFEQVYAKVVPLAVRLDKATRNLLLPALADGQCGLVIDAKFTSHQFIKSLPRTEQALTMFEPALIVGVSDAAKLKQAFEEYYAVADDFVEVLKGIDKSEIPKNFKVPRPKIYPIRQGTVYGYPLPAELGVDTRVLPNAGLSEKVAVLSLSGKHSLRLLRETEPKIAGLALSTDRPLASVGGVDFAGLIDALDPWVELGLQVGTAQLQPDMAENARVHTKAVIEVLKVFRGAVSETYVEDKVTVTHSRTEIHDIAE